MVEGEPDSKHNRKSDVKDDRPNGCGSKDLELARLGTKGKTLDPEKGSFEKADFEKAIELTGYGKFHYFLLAVCGLVSTSEEMDVISMSYILPSAQCDLDLDTHRKGWMSSIIFIGMMVGAYAWGSVADALGRRKVLIVISIMNAVCIVASSFTQRYEYFLLFRFLNGAALGGSGPVIWSYFAEFQPKAKRGSMLSFMAAFWTLGNLFVAGLAWLIIPSGIGFDSLAFKYNSWRIFLLICAAPSFLVAGLLLLLPESPKYLLIRGREKEALEIFRGIYAINTGQSRTMYPVKKLIFDDSRHRSEKASTKPQSKCKMLFGDILGNTKQLFISPILRFTLISIIINFTFHIGYYGLMMWFPELFNRFDKYQTAHPNVTSIGICEVTDFVVNNKTQESNVTCTNEISAQVFQESLITVASAIPANILAVVGMDRLGRKFFLVFSTFSAGLCSTGLYFVTNKTHNLIVSAFFSGVISCGNAALDCLITEVFPTNLRATGVAISMVAARLGGIIGNIVIAQLLDTYCPAPTFIVAALLIGGGLMCLGLPNTTRQPLS
ncbi:synaptic vesicle glycoprotein 2C [Neodiprion pinetum]|uniref:Synaptic vesicle glycoprotein 2C n=1 Tax=Neodiprion lecontei TaxID=441921 RepID=A0A6J0C5Z0_NEOLC|nr:synaptic vesicle glycoprotein 2C [Neodiprion lecontei]XP_015521845.2 synaptic vesicle glycoprotein 2C [Neodiprion lecontei]XP_046429204.1 synaptic vesicle glycoprotein 2C [Neodiprion fabricii]XP_046429205.1 synaptic vesicle glycoprotein 2C [Neodiprion fabricii]XP_046429206.1 synaptic vesicle glycoprotein 2C [Neodiprion fabricii]XP_046485862.1 synaptic vesicle glycoprotein 2C [Neodiprion pinetum]XP_046485863.1 synaptic vesicle glycoprotein 2C [Neodiprion pinetum]XP_046485864.1 synaptic ves